MVKSRISVIVLILAFGALLGPSDLSSCFGPPVEPVFTGSRGPVNGLAFVRGQIGIVQPWMRERHLAIAYRVLNDVPVSDIDAKTLYPPAEAMQTYEEQLAAGDAFMRSWLADREQVPDLPHIDRIDLYAHGRGSEFQNCYKDAFVTATNHLNKLARQSGWMSGRVRRWVEAQDQVFANCPSPAAIPEPLQDSEPIVDRQDREYQIGAALLYAGKPDKAAEQFRKIANDSSSEWRELAAYLVGRALFRRDHQSAQAYLAELVTKTSNPAARERAQALLDRIFAMQNPAARLAQAGKRIGQVRDVDLPHELEDYQFLWKTLENNAKGDQIEAAAKSDDMTDWICTIEGGSQQDELHAFEIWQQRKTVVWLIAALRSNSDSAHLKQLLAVARKIRGSSPAFYSIAFYGAIALERAHRNDEARQILNYAITTNPPLETKNFLIAARMKIARSWQEFLADAPRRAAGETSGEEREVVEVDAKFRNRLLLDWDAAEVLNRDVPLDLIAPAAKDKSLPSGLRSMLTGVGWTRAVMLRRLDVARDLAPSLAELEPSLTQDMSRFASSEPERQLFIATYVILRNPGLSVQFYPGWGRGGLFWPSDSAFRPRKLDEFRDNWWCADTPKSLNDRDLAEEANSLLYGHRGIHVSFVNPEQRKEANAEWARIRELGTAPNALSRVVIEWAKSHGDDPLVPEALHLAVRATHYGCKDKASPVYSREAFQLLHRRYRGSVWTKRTPYWFNGES